MKHNLQSQFGALLSIGALAALLSFAHAVLGCEPLKAEPRGLGLSPRLVICGHTTPEPPAAMWGRKQHLGSCSMGSSKPPGPSTPRILHWEPAGVLCIGAGHQENIISCKDAQTLEQVS